MLELKNISRNFGGFDLRDINFTVRKGDYFLLLGPSGAGKSLLLEMIAGLTLPDSGSVLLNGSDITTMSIPARRIGIVFQDHAIFPHMTVRKNLAYSLHGLKKDETERRITNISSRLLMTGLLDRKPATLSGGELQRVALARTLIREPEILLLDEPLSSIDARIKSDLRRLLREIHRGGQTIMHVTHDYEEALSLATRIAVMDHGKILQTGTPAEVFQHPRNGFVAHFIGVRNFFPAKLITVEGLLYAVTGGDLRIRINDGQENETGFVMIRGEDIVLSERPLESSAVNSFPGIISEIVKTPFGIDISVECGELLHAVITEQSLASLHLEEEKTVWLTIKATAVKFISG